MKLSKREITLVIILVLAASTALFYWKVFMPDQLKMEAIAKETSDQIKVLNDLKNKKQQTDKYMQEVVSIESDIRSLESIMPDDRDIPGMLVLFYEMLNKNHLAGDVVKFGEIQQSDEFDSYTVSYDAKGKSQDVDSFLRQLESMKSEISITGLKLTAQDQTDLDMSITITIYINKTANRSYIPHDYGFMEANGGVYAKWYDMIKTAVSQIAADNNMPGGINGTGKK